MKLKKFFASKKIRYGSLATGLTAAFVVIMIAVNIVCSLLVERFPLKVDLTEEKLFNISDESLALFEEVKEPIEIFVLANEKEIEDSGKTGRQLNETLKLFKQHCSDIKITYVDLTVTPTFTRQYPSETLEKGGIVIQSDRRYRYVPAFELYIYHYDDYGNPIGVVGTQAELKIATAVAGVISERLPLAVVAVGHEEQPLDGLIALLKRNNYDIKSQNLIKDEIDQNADFIIIGAPKRDYSEETLKKLDAFLANETEEGAQYGKNVFITFDAEQPILPNLERFVSDWGIAVGSEMLWDTSYDVYFFTQYGQSDFTAALNQKGVTTVSTYARPLTRLFETDIARDTVMILQSAPTCVLRPADAGADWDAGKAAKAVVPILVQGKRYRYVSGETSTTLTSGVIVSGSHSMFLSEITNNNALGNAELSLALFDQLFDGNKIDLDIYPKELGGKEFALESNQDVWIGLVVFTILIPVLVLATGLVIWFRRRHL